MNLFDERLKRIEQEIDDIKTARQRITGATSTVSKVVTVKATAIDQEYGRPYGVNYTVITIKPQNPDNGFFFYISQPGVQESGWVFDFYTATSFDMTEFQAVVGFNASREKWTPGQTREFIKQATIVASGQFEYSVEYKEPEP